MAAIFSSEELLALKQFRESIGDILLNYDEYDSNDRNLIRWLRARDLNLMKAENMIRKSTKYRQEHPALANLLHIPFPEDLLEQLPFRPVGYDKRGTIVAVICAGKWKFKKLVLGGKHEEIRLYASQLLDKCYAYMKSTRTVEDMDPQVNVIVDFNQFSVPEHLSKLAAGTKLTLIRLNLPCFLVISFAIELTLLLDLNYPEFLKTAYVINVPRIFNMGWSLISPFLAPRTISKIKIISGGPEKWRRVLLEEIDPRELPSEYGGTNTAHPAYYTNARGFHWPPRAPLLPTQEFVTVVVPARDKLVKSFELAAGNRMYWNFKTDLYDIGFEFTLNGARMFPYAKADSHMWTQDGLVDVEEAGEYSLVFDNSYSKYRSKTLHYAILLEN